MDSTTVAKHLNHIAKEDSTLAKKALLAIPHLSVYLEAAYNPYKMYHMKKFPPLQTDNQHFTVETWRILSALEKRHITGNTAKDIVYDHIQYLTPPSQELFKRICRKDLKCGVSTKLINAVFPNLLPTFTLMKPKDWEPGKLKLPIYGSPKIDGMRGAWRHGKMLSTKGILIPGLTQMVSNIKKQGATFVDFDGELTIPLKSFEELGGELRSHREKPNALFGIFDIPSENKLFTQRYNILRKYYASIPGVYIIPHKLLYNYDEVIGYYELCLSKGMEGTVYKTPDHLYQEGESWDWIRLKPDSTYDVKVVGTVPGKPGSKYEHQLGALVCDFQGNRFRLSGMSDDERKKWGDDPDSIVGGYVEVKCKGVTAKGSLREPVYVRERRDK